MLQLRTKGCNVYCDLSWSGCIDRIFTRLHLSLSEISKDQVWPNFTIYLIAKEEHGLNNVQRSEPKRTSIFSIF